MLNDELLKISAETNQGILYFLKTWVKVFKQVLHHVVIGLLFFCLRLDHRSNIPRSDLARTFLQIYPCTPKGKCKNIGKS